MCEKGILASRFMTKLSSHLKQFSHRICFIYTTEMQQNKKNKKSNELHYLADIICSAS
jgi:hypothetical protein